MATKSVHALHTSLSLRLALLYAAGTTILLLVLGAGLAWHHTWDTDDGLAANLRIGDAVGPVVQGGIEVPIGARFGVYVEARKAFYSVDASGDLGPARVTAEPKLDPFILQAGAVLRF